MTIKKRLFISNILMIVIPIILALITLLVAYEVLNTIFHDSLDEFVESMENMETNQKMKLEASWDNMQAHIFIVGFFCVAGLIAVVYLTNRLLIKFVFRRIEQPLEVLTQGVRQIKNGNLDHRISYSAQDEFRPICEDFNEMAGRLKSSVEETLKNEQSRKELIAGISHDLRSPLTSIKAYVEGLIDGVATTHDAQREYLQTIKTKTDDISKMVSQLFLFSKMDTGNYPVNPEILDISREINDFINATRDDYKTKGLSVIAKNIPKEIFIYADPTQLRSVFTNILDNSAKYNDKKAAEILVHCETTSESILIIFDDNGPGVPPDSLPKLFDVFYRGDSSRSNPQQGSGLGLAIASKMISLMEGNICAENRAEGGLRITIKIAILKERKE